MVDFLTGLQLGSDIICQHRLTGEVSFPNSKNSFIMYRTMSNLPCVCPGCTSGDVRLAGSGSSSTRGRVELCHNNQWGTICDDGWDNSDAEVICKQLKYSSYGTINGAIIIIMVHTK